MTGAYVRIQRQGTWQPVEIDQMTDAELEALAASQPEAGWTWAMALARWIRDNVQEERPQGVPVPAGEVFALDVSMAEAVQTILQRIEATGEMVHVTIQPLPAPVTSHRRRPRTPPVDPVP